MMINLLLMTINRKHCENLSAQFNTQLLLITGFLINTKENISSNINQILEGLIYI